MAAFRLSDSSDHPTEADLIERTLAGDGNAFAILVERFQRRIYRVARSIVRDEQEADVVTQDTFVQAYTNLSRFEGRAGFETWLTRIAINRSRDTLRRRRFVSLFSLSGGSDDGEQPLIEPVDDRPDPERALLATQLGRAIRKAESQLSSQQKIIFRLRHYENLALEEIAEHLGLRAGTVRAHLFRAVHKIRKELQEWRSTRTVQGNEHEALQ